MDLENLQETIKKYLDGNMTPQEKADFEKERTQSTALQKEVDQARELRVFLRNRELIAANTLLQSIMAETPIEPDYQGSKIYFKDSVWDSPLLKWFLGSCTVVILISGVFFYQKNQTNRFLSDIAQNHLQAMTNFIGFLPTDESDAAKGMRAYDHKNYVTSIDLLKNAANETDLQLYLAISYLMQGQKDPAESLLKGLIQSNDMTAVPAKWYLSLLWLQKSEKEKAIHLLQKLESDATFGNKAKALLSDLN